MPPGYPFRGVLHLWGQRAAVDAGHGAMWLEDVLLSAAVGLGRAIVGEGLADARDEAVVYHPQRFRLTMRRDRLFALLGIAWEAGSGLGEGRLSRGERDRAAAERGKCKTFAETAVWMMSNLEKPGCPATSTPWKQLRPFAAFLLGCRTSRVCQGTSWTLRCRVTARMTDR